MSLRDGTAKMSKSAELDGTRINLVDDKDTIVKKISKAKTDIQMGLTYEDTRPEICNLIRIYSALSGDSIESICKQFESAPHSKFKEALSSVIIEKIVPIGEEIKKLRNDVSEIDKILEDGAKKAREIAAETMKEVRDVVGLL
jgi:tryptophanyl-tRNA synthetase